MLFNSYAFFCFFLLVFPCYWLIFSRRIWVRNLFLIVSSYFFYGWWDYRFLCLVVLSSAVDYVVALGIAKTDDWPKRKRLLAISIGFNLGALGFFKYHNFFLANLNRLCGELGIQLDTPTLEVILPLGISFYTLQTLGYTIDVYRRRIQPTRDVLAFFAYVCFFPQLVAGPIERAARLLPQFTKLHRFDYAAASDALRQVLWGLFKKVVIADGCAGLADPVFASFSDQSASTLAVAAFYFSIQIYCDFSGYSDIAIGLGKLLGFDLMKNFDRPYFSTSVFEFWRRWHISLSTWLRDYLYIPLGGSRGTRWRTILNLWIVFSVSGLWHGAQWNYIFWGWLHFLYLLPAILFRHVGVARRAEVSADPQPRGHASRLVTQPCKTVAVFLLVTYAWILFRVPGGQASIDCAASVIDWSVFSKPDCSRIGFLWVIVLLAAEWWQGGRDHALQIGRWPVLLRWMLYVILTILCLGNFQDDSPFIYFQF